MSALLKYTSLRYRFPSPSKQSYGSALQTEQDISGSKDSSDFWLCPKCGAPMMVIERLTAAEIQLGSPPALVTEAA
jgi:hypothetical protein